MLMMGSQAVFPLHPIEATASDTPGLGRATGRKQVCCDEVLLGVESYLYLASQ